MCNNLFSILPKHIYVSRKQSKLQLSLASIVALYVHSVVAGLIWKRKTNHNCLSYPLRKQSYFIIADAFSD